MPADTPTVAIIGAGLAGFQVAAALREFKFEGRVLLIGEEPHRPYQRPPLSKAYLLGAEESTLALRPDTYYSQKQIEWLASTRAVSIDRTHRKVALDNGSVIGFDHLVLAVGARNRPLHVPGYELNGVFFLRHLDEARALRVRLHKAKRAVVIGAGFIGLEFAASARKSGVDVTVLEVADRPMSRALSAPMGRLFAREHAKAGVLFAFSTQVKRLVEDEGHVAGVETMEGEVIDADLVLIGIGVIPNVELAATCNLEVRNGIAVDRFLMTADPHISALGDCASYPSAFSAEESVRLESVQNASDQARTVAAGIVGKAVPYAAVPWFWSDQGDLKLQIAGLTTGHDQAVVRGDPDGTSCSVYCFREGRLLGIESVNRPGDHMVGRRLIGNRAPLTAAQAADEGVDLKAVAAAAATAAAVPVAAVPGAERP
jgi:3-phenylpropionate/trans-cinnamate dioxygenase ferredoxin reductase component